MSDEQKMYIEKSIRLATSDSQFAKKLYDSIIHILTDGNTVLPVVTSITPSSAVLGSPSFDVHVMGSGFTPTTKIVFNGFEEPTTFVSDKELTTGVNMDVWLAPAIVPVGVVNDAWCTVRN